MAAAGIVAAVHYHRLGLTLAHYDARDHPVFPRRIFDSLFPGWQQVGGVWLPLPHLLNALPVQIDWLYRTGYSAIAISIAAMAAAAWAIAFTIQRATGSIAGGAVAAALLALNPNVLYLQSTPMTEPLLFGTTFLAVAMVARWCGYGGTAARVNTLAAGWALVAAALTRFEAWPIVVVLVLSASLVLVRNGTRTGDALRRVRGLALWPMWAVLAFLVNSKITVGSWFVASGFFVPDNPARGRLLASGLEVWDGLVHLSGSSRRGSPSPRRLSRCGSSWPGGAIRTPANGNCSSSSRSPCARCCRGPRTTRGTRCESDTMYRSSPPWPRSSAQAWRCCRAVWRRSRAW